jgi:hypothetical protein
MLDGVMLLWFILTAASLIFVSIDIWRTPEATVLKWGFIILTAFAGPLGAFFYVLGCREPLPGTHEQYVSATWRQVLGSAMHCAAGDGLGILAGAVLASLLDTSMAVDIAIEYVFGFGFGWAFFQAFAMRDMAGGNYIKSLKMTFIPELFSMNLLMVGMLLLSKFWMSAVDGAGNPAVPAFWFIMSMSLVAGFLFAYPMNWWLVTRGLKHGMMTVRQSPSATKDPPAMTSMPASPEGMEMPSMHEMQQGNGKASMGEGHTGSDMSHMSSEHEGHTGVGSGTKPSPAKIFAVGSLSVISFAVAVAIVLTLA